MGGSSSEGEGRSPAMSKPPTAATLVVFRPRELPAALAMGLPPDAALRDCLCYIAHPDARATAGLFEALPEPPIEHAALGLPFANGIMRIAARSRRLVELIRPEQTRDGPARLGVCTVGIHAGNADEVAAWLRARGHRLVPVREVLDALLILLPTIDGAHPAGRIAVLRAVDGRLVEEVFQEAAPGVVALERAGVTNGALTIRCNRYRAHLASLPATGLFALRLTARDPKYVSSGSREIDAMRADSVDPERLARREVAALLDPRGVVHDPKTSWPIWFLLPAAVVRGAWDVARGGRALGEQPDRLAVVEAVVARWVEHVLDDDAFEIDDMSRYREAMAAVEGAVGVDAVRAAGRDAIARLYEGQGKRFQRLTAPRLPRRVVAGPGVSRCVECILPVRGRHYVFRCDRGHEGRAHPACARRHVARLLGERAHGELACSLASGCHLVACARAELEDDPHGARLLRTMLGGEARRNAVSRILVALLSARLVEDRIAWTAKVGYLGLVDEADARARIEEMVDAIDAPTSFREGVRSAVMREIRLR